MQRRDVLKALGAAPLAAGFSWSDSEAGEALQRATAARQTATPSAPYKPVFFNEHEYETVRVLADLIIPRDERSGSASDAGVPEFIDFIVGDQPARQTAMRGGLAWLDYESVTRFDKRFIECAPAEQTAVLDDIAWPDRARPEMARGVAFFNSFRDLTAAGFYTSRMGIDDLQYKGNVYVRTWNGCPDEACQKLGVSYPAQ
jgi:gluconate 2-dehydrogenase gamma chain